MRELSIRHRAALTPDRVALVWAGAETTFGQLADEAATLSFPADELVVLSEPSSRALFVKLVALLDAERPFALLHPRLTASERDAQERHVRAHQHSVPEGTAAVLFTSGSTGRAKAACLSRRAFVASAQATAAHLGHDVLARWLLALPLCHVGGLSVLTRALVHGTCVVLEDHFDPRAAFVLAARERLTGASLVPTLLQRLLNETSEPLDRFGTVVVGGAATSPVLLERARARQLRVLCTYGMTETCAQITLETSDTEPRSSGVVLGDTCIEIVPAGAVGAIHVSGPTLFSGYLGEPAPVVPFDTGDLGRLDQAGRLHVESRRTDLVVTGGENVYPLEVERVLLGCELIREALVFGVPDETWGQRVCALLVADAGAAEQVEAYMREHLAPHKRPKRIVYVEQLPTLANGKVDRRGAADTLATRG